MDLVVDVNRLADDLARVEDLGARHPRKIRTVRARLQVTKVAQHLELVLGRDVGHPDLEQKPVELRIRQREGSGDIERILRCDD